MKYKKSNRKKNKDRLATSIIKVSSIASIFITVEQSRE